MTAAKTARSIVAAGRHGEHHLFGPQVRVGDDIALPEGGLLVHTDVPSARHGAIRLVPGVWRVGHLRELGLDAIVVRVAD